MRRVEALRDKQLEAYERSQKQDKSKKEKTNKDQLEKIKKELINYKTKPDFSDSRDLIENLKILTKQLEKIKIKSVIEDKNKNKIKDKKIGNLILRQQILNDFPPKELRSVIDQGKKDIKNGIIICISTFEDKVGIAIGITNDLISKYDAVNLVKIASKILDGKGGGGRKDFAQAGGINKNKIDDAFKAVADKIN